MLIEHKDSTQKLHKGIIQPQEPSTNMHEQESCTLHMHECTTNVQATKRAWFAYKMDISYADIVVALHNG